MRISLLLLLCLNSAFADCRVGLRLNVDRETLMPVEQQELDWLTAVLQQNNCPLNVIKSAAATTRRRLTDLRDGQADVWFGCSKTSDREQYLYFSEPYFLDEVRRYVRSGEQARYPSADFAELLQQGARITGPLTGWYGSAFEQFRAQHQHDKRLMFYRHYVREALNLLLQHRADVLITTKRQMAGIEPLFAAQFSFIEPALLNDPLHIVFSKKTVLYKDYQRLTTAISAALPLRESADGNEKSGLK